MKYILVLTLFFSCTISNAQKMFPHEKEIGHKDLYKISDINFFNAEDAISLFGTLITPKKTYNKIVIIVPGSGKDTRYSHYKLTEEFLKNNIAVYRFDERGVGTSQGSYSSNISTLSKDLSYCILSLKKQFKNKKIGVLGHSLGAMASVLTTQNSSVKIDFLIQLATPVKNFSSASKYQIKTFTQHHIKNKSTKQIVNLLDTLTYITTINKKLHTRTITIREKGIEAIKTKGFEVKDITFWSLAHINLFQQDFEKVYKNLHIPTIYLIGTNDTFINPKTEIQYLKNYNNPLVTIRVMKNLNHYLTKGVLNASILYNIDKSASKTIINWVRKI